jgi:hypothetical protein
VILASGSNKILLKTTSDAFGQERVKRVFQKHGRYPENGITTNKEKLKQPYSLEYVI